MFLIMDFVLVIPKLIWKYHVVMFVYYVCVDEYDMLWKYYIILYTTLWNTWNDYVPYEMNEDMY